MMRRARETDFDDIYMLYMDSVTNRYLAFDSMSPEDFRGVFDRLLVQRECYVFEEHDHVLAALTVDRNDMRMAHVASLGTIAVHYDAHGTGVGSHFLSQVLAMLAEEGVHRVELTVDIDNPGAISFYESLGFYSEGILHAYVKRAGEPGYVDNVLMSMLIHPVEEATAGADA